MKSDMFRILCKEVIMIKRVKNTIDWTYDISDLKEKENVETFYKNNCKKQIKKRLDLKK